MKAQGPGSRVQGGWVGVGVVVVAAGITICGQVVVVYYTVVYVRT